MGLGSSRCLVLSPRLGTLILPTRLAVSGAATIQSCHATVLSFPDTGLMMRPPDSNLIIKNIIQK